jgi:hypothetical protein
VGPKVFKSTENSEPKTAAEDRQMS